MPAPRPINFLHGDPRLLAETAFAVGERRDFQRQKALDLQFLSAEMDRRQKAGQARAQLGFEREQFEETRRQGRAGIDAFRLQRAGARRLAGTPTQGRTGRIGLTGQDPVRAEQDQARLGILQEQLRRLKAGESQTGRTAEVAAREGQEGSVPDPRFAGVRGEVPIPDLQFGGPRGDRFELQETFTGERGFVPTTGRTELPFEGALDEAPFRPQPRVTGAGRTAPQISVDVARGLRALEAARGLIPPERLAFLEEAVRTGRLTSNALVNAVEAAIPRERRPEGRILKDVQLNIARLEAKLAGFDQFNDQSGERARATRALIDSEKEKEEILKQRPFNPNISHSNAAPNPDPNAISFATAAQGAPRIRNPQTGEIVVLINGQWVPEQ